MLLVLSVDGTERTDMSTCSSTRHQRPASWYSPHTHVDDKFAEYCLHVPVQFFLLCHTRNHSYPLFAIMLPEPRGLASLKSSHSRAA